jgi:hypothetical protein
MKKYVFKQWEDGTLTSFRIINLKANMEVIAYYKEVTEMGKVTFSGSVSAQEKEGEQVTITITKPDGSTATLTTLTKVDLTFSVEYEDIVGDGYKAKARIEADALYQSAESNEVIFSIGKEPRTITLSVA